MTGPPQLSNDLDALLRRVARGDNDAFAAFYDHTKSRVYGLVIRVLRDSGYSEETTQEVYLEVWRTASVYDSAKGSALAWLLTMAHRRAIDRVRSEQAGSRRESRYGAANVDMASDVVSDSAIAMVSGPCLPKPGQPLRLTTHMHFIYEEHPCFPTMNVFYRRSVFEALGGFDVSLSTRDPLGRAVEATDADLGWRVIEAGYPRRFLPDAIIYHEVQNLGVIGYVIEPTRHLFVPELVRRHPGMRRALLTAGVFFYPATWLVYIALIVVILAALMQPWLLLMVPALLIGRAIARTRSLRPDKLMWWCASALLQLPRTFVASLTFAYASVRFRALVL